MRGAKSNDKGVFIAGTKIKLKTTNNHTLRVALKYTKEMMGYQKQNQIRI